MKILWISDFGGSGYSTASIETINGLLETDSNFEIYLFCINNYHDLEFHTKLLNGSFSHPDKIHIFVPEKNADVCNMPLTDEFNKKLIINEIMGFNDLGVVIKSIEPDICIILNDNKFIESYYKLIKKSKINTKIIAYMPVDCHIFAPGTFNFLEKYDKVLTMSNFAKDEIMKTGFRNEIIVLNHPIPNVFKPISKSEARKLEIYANINKNDLENAFIVLNFNDNTPERKHIELTVKAFAIFMKNNPDANAFLVIKAKRPTLLGTKNVNYDDYLSIYPELNKKIIYINKHLTTDDIKYLYNSVNVAINTSYGEGWGLIACETALCGIPQILPDNTCHKEIFKESCKLIETETLLGNIKKEDKKNVKNIILLFKGVKDHLESGIHEVDIVVNNNFKLNMSILVSERISNSNYAYGMLKLTDNFVFNTGTNNLEDIKVFIRKMAPYGFLIYVETDETFKFLYDEIIKFSWEELVDIYNIEQLKTSSIKSIYESGFVEFRLPKVEKIADMIEYYYKNPDKALEDGIKCQNEILYYNKERIGKELKNILEGFRIKKRVEKVI